jgi:SAM-dependent methyltransferase
MDASSGVGVELSTTLADWFATPLGQYVLAREQAWFDRTVADIFGFHAIQIGLPLCPFLAQSRIAARWTVAADGPAQIRADPHWLPFPENSLDLIVLPHALEFAQEPHQTLREVYRAMRAEGQILISGFNPFSLFGARRYFGRGRTPPWTGNFIALYRLKDWLTLLGFEVTGGALDCYALPIANETWRARWGLVEAAGDRWWPVGGGVYFLRATKKVLGMRVITPAWERRKNGLAAAPGQARQCIERRRDTAPARAE